MQTHGAQVNVECDWGRHRLSLQAGQIAGGSLPDLSVVLDNFRFELVHLRVHATRLEARFRVRAQRVSDRSQRNPATHLKKIGHVPLLTWSALASA